jgi:hypothetical protein
MFQFNSELRTMLSFMKFILSWRTYVFAICYLYTGTCGKTMYCAVPVSLVRWMLLSNCSGSMHALVYGIAHTHGLQLLC